MSEKKLKRIPLKNLIAMNYRKVNVDDMVESLISSGQKATITVTPQIKDGKETGNYIIVDGWRRYTASKIIVESAIETEHDFSELDCVIDYSYNIEEEGESFRLNQLIFNEVHKSTNIDTYIAIAGLVKSGTYKASQISKALGYKDESYAGTISKLIIDDQMYLCYLSGDDLFSDNAKRTSYRNWSAFFKVYENLISETDLDRLSSFQASESRTSLVYEKAVGAKIFQNPEMKDVVVYKGFGDETPVSIFSCKALANYYQKYCVSHDKKEEALTQFHRALKSFMKKKVKKEKTITNTVQLIIDTFIEVKPKKAAEPKIVPPKDIAKKIFNIFKDVELTKEDISSIKKELKMIFKDDKYKDRINVDFKLSIKE